MNTIRSALKMEKNEKKSENDLAVGMHQFMKKIKCSCYSMVSRGVLASEMEGKWCLCFLDGGTGGCAGKGTDTWCATFQH